MEIDENSWFRRTPPTDEEIGDVWHDLLIRTQDEVIQWLPANSPAISFLDKQSIHNVHLCISTKHQQDLDYRQSASDADADEMPSFEPEETPAVEEPVLENPESSTESTEDDENNSDAEEELDDGGVILEENQMYLTEKSVLRLCMEIRTFTYQHLSAGINMRKIHGIEIPNGMAIKIVQKMSKNQRAMLADILLYQLATQFVEEELDPEINDAEDLPSIIDAHLDLLNIREFHAQLAGK